MSPNANAAGNGLLPTAIVFTSIDVDALIAAAPDALLVTPAHQFPTGVVLAPERRARILAWAQEADALVIRTTSTPSTGTTALLSARSRA
jgi:GntR family transcriptional regulator/MocR family aminotransferase